MSQLLFEHGDLKEVQGPLEELTPLDPKKCVGSRKDDFESATAAYRESLKHRPNSAPTCLQLGHALKGCDRMNEAIEAWEQGLRIDPNNEEIRQVLCQAKT